jgi:hypothetical protein
MIRPNPIYQRGEVHNQHNVNDAPRHTDDNDESGLWKPEGKSGPIYYVTEQAREDFRLMLERLKRRKVDPTYVECSACGHIGRLTGNLAQKISKGDEDRHRLVCSKCDKRGMASIKSEAARA